MTKKRSSKPKPTASAKAPSTGTRSRTRERREERQKQKRQQQQIGLLIGIVVLAVIAVAVFILSNLPEDAPIPEGTLERYAGIPQGSTEEGFPILGRTDAPVRVEEFSSFACPGCQQFHENAFDQLVEFVRQGVISFTFIPMATGSLSNQEGSARAAICAGEQGRFFEYHDMLFSWHEQYSNRAFLQNRLTSGAEALGLDSAAFSECLGSAGVDDIRDAAEARFAATQGVTGTPAVLVQGVLVETSGTGLADAINQALVQSGQTPIPLDTLPADGDDAADPSTPETESTPATEEATDQEATEEASSEATAEATPEATSEGS